LQIKTKIVSCHTADYKPVKQEVNGTVILPPLVVPVFIVRATGDIKWSLGFSNVTFSCHFFLDSNPQPWDDKTSALPLSWLL
jgi:hypothetical protein